MNREMLAWAAGFFDGEGSMGFYDSFSNYRGRRYGTKKLILQVTQKEPDILYRLATVLDCGVVRGPYLKSRKYPIYRYTVQDFEHIQATVALLWAWLGSSKQKQCAHALNSSRMWRARKEMP